MAKTEPKELERFTISCSDVSLLSARALVGCALRTRKLVHGMHPTEGNGWLYGIVNCSSAQSQSCRSSIAKIGRRKKISIESLESLGSVGSPDSKDPKNTTDSMDFFQRAVVGVVQPGGELADGQGDAGCGRIVVEGIIAGPPRWARSRL